MDWDWDGDWEAAPSGRSNHPSSSCRPSHFTSRHHFLVSSPPIRLGNRTDSRTTLNGGHQSEYVSLQVLPSCIPLHKDVTYLPASNAGPN
ncbi:hypothetical protein CKAH01_11850 [Colletotrichum kahawae]|uniref:Uncharacterized protein n=1 Tax=Colletotrichum kahawae TaxID=34407 RepID=A0AAD9YUW5_COLKA|nr:hypothetical protein CKAH01_11850 [Colletotrichum kahawae]